MFMIAATFAHFLQVLKAPFAGLVELAFAFLGLIGHWVFLSSFACLHPLSPEEPTLSEELSGPVHASYLISSITLTLL